MKPILNNNKYFSDASITGGVRWNIGMLDITNFRKETGL